MAIALALIGGVAILAELALLHFPFTYSFVVFLIWLGFPAFIAVLAFYRNRIFEKLLIRFSSYAFLVFARFWRIYYNLVFISTMLLFILGIDFPSNSIFKIIPILIFGVTLPFYYLFKFDVTSEEEIIILFENLLSNLDHFSRRNVFWRKISKKIEEVLKTGNIEVSKDDLIYYFNDKRWETNSNITNQLRDIELWLLDKRRTCFDSIRQIVPVVCFQPIKRKPLLKNIALEPTSAQVEIIKVLGYVIVAVLLIVLIIVHPDLGNQIINHLPSL